MQSDDTSHTHTHKNTPGTMEGERWVTEGIKQIPEQRQERVFRRDSHRLINSNSRSRGAECIRHTAISTSAVCVSTSSSAGPGLHTPAAPLTNNSKRLLVFWLSGPDMVQTFEDYTGKGNSFGFMTIQAEKTIV